MPPPRVQRLLLKQWKYSECEELGLWGSSRKRDYQIGLIVREGIKNVQNFQKSQLRQIEGDKQVCGDCRVLEMTCRAGTGRLNTMFRMHKIDKQSGGNKKKNEECSRKFPSFYNHNNPPSLDSVKKGKKCQLVERLILREKLIFVLEIISD